METTNFCTTAARKASYTKKWDLPCLSPHPDPCISVDIFADNKPQEITWTLEDGSNNQLTSGTHTGMNCFDTTNRTDVCYDFKIADSGNDGICCSHGAGSYALNWGITQLHKGGGNYGAGETVQICDPAHCVLVYIIPDAYPDDTSWEIKEKSSGTIISSGDENGNNCVSNLEYNTCYTFVLYDQFGDGLLKKGKVEVFYQYNELLSYTGGDNLPNWSKKEWPICVGSNCPTC